MKILAWIWVVFAGLVTIGALTDRLFAGAAMFIVSALIAMPVPALQQYRDKLGITEKRRAWAIPLSAVVAMITLGGTIPDTPERRAERLKAEQARAVEDAAAAKRAAEEKAAEDKRIAAEKAAAEAKEAEERKSGFHCLSAWDGSHRGIVDALKDDLRDPDSFQHVETRITPTDAKGNHMLMMRYRARNGFGGMNIGRLAAVVKDSDCSFEIVANDSN